MRGARFTLASGSPPPAPDLTLPQDFEPIDYRGDRHDLGPEAGPGACREEKQANRGTDCLCVEEAELGTSVAEVCRKMGISQATFYVRTKRYADVGPLELRRLVACPADT